MRICPQCQKSLAEIPTGQTTCPHCGASLPPPIPIHATISATKFLPRPSSTLPLSSVLRTLDLKVSLPASSSSPSQDAANAPAQSPLSPRTTATIGPTATLDLNAVMAPKATLAPNTTLDPKSTPDPQATFSPAATLDLNATFDPKATFAPNATIDLNATFDPNATAQPLATFDLGTRAPSPPPAAPGALTQDLGAAGVAGLTVGNVSSEHRSRRRTGASTGGSEIAFKLGSGASLEQLLAIKPRILVSDSPPGVPFSRGDYDILRKLGEGGMGIVYEAVQSSIRRTVALKMLKPGATEFESAQREKFLTEAVFTGELEHPNIVPIYDLGRDERGVVFYAMKHVKGTPWDRLLPKKSLQENLEILLKVSDGVAFAHSRGVVHRDLKPENVMIGAFGEVLVMDWGLALSLDIPIAETSMGGTPAYMAPEMTMGPAELIDETSDVYLLGAILFEIVTGARPHNGATVWECLIAAAENVIVPTDKSGELVDIALRAMSTQQAERYPSVPDFQAALRQYQSHLESIALATRAKDDLELAKTTGKYDLFARALFAFQEAISLWEGYARARAGVHEAIHEYASCALRNGDYDLGLSLLADDEERHVELADQLRQAREERNSRQRKLQAARRIGALAIAAFVIVVVGAFFWIRSEANRALAAEQVAKSERNNALDKKREAEIATEAADSARKSAELAQLEEERQRRAAEQAKAQQEYAAYVARLGLASAKIADNAFDHALTLLEECPPSLRNWEWGRLRFLCSRDDRTLTASVPLEALAISPDGHYLATGGWGGIVQLFHLAGDAAPRTIVTGTSEVFALAFSPDGSRLAIGTSNNPHYVSIWDTKTGEQLRLLEGHRDAVLTIRYSRDGNQLLTGSYDNTARLWNLRDGTSRAFVGHDWWVWSAEFSPDERRIVTASQDGSVLLWDVTSGKTGPPFLGHGGPVFAATFSPDGNSVASAGLDQRILLWRPDSLMAVDIATALRSSDKKTDSLDRDVTALTGHSAAVRGLAYSADGRLLASAGHDNVVAVWDVTQKRLLKKFRGHASRVNSALFVPGDRQLVSASLDQSVKFWDIGTYEEMRVIGGRSLQAHRDSVLGAAFSPDGKVVVTASRDRTAIAWDAETGELLRRYDEGHQFLASSAWSYPDGKRLLTAAVDNSARIWDVATGAEQATLSGTGPHAAVTLARSGEMIATGSDRKSIKLWDSAGNLLREFGGLTSDITAIAISPDETKILAGDSTGRTQIRSTIDGRVLWESRSHSRSITNAVFVAQGDWAATSSLDRTVALWNVATGEEDRRRVLKHPDAVTSLAVSPDGTIAITACADKTVRVWDLSTAREIRTLGDQELLATGVAITADGQRALIVTADNRVRIWDLTEEHRNSEPWMLDLAATKWLAWSATFTPDLEKIVTVGGAEAHLWNLRDRKMLASFAPQSAVSSVQFSPDGQMLLTGGWDNAARLWNVATGGHLRKLDQVHRRFVNATAFAPDGKQVATASDDGTAQLWNVESGQPTLLLQGHAAAVTDIAFSPVGDRLATASADKTVRIWDARTGVSLRELRGHTQSVLRLVYSRDGRRLLTGGEDSTARLWDAESGEQVGVTLLGHTSAVSAVAFSTDATRAFTGSRDRTIKVWDPSTGKEVLSLTGHNQEVTTVAVSHDNRRLLTASRDGTAIIWQSTPWSSPPAKVASGSPKDTP